MSEAKKDPKMFRESLSVINHPRALILPSDFFKKREEKAKERNGGKTDIKEEEFHEAIIEK